MPSRIGITRDLKISKEQNELLFEGIHSWEEWGPFPSLEHAKEWEKDVAEKFNCETIELAKDGNEDSPAPWFTYRFSYRRMK